MTLSGPLLTFLASLTPAPGAAPPPAAIAQQNLSPSIFSPQELRLAMALLQPPPPEEPDPTAEEDQPPATRSGPPASAARLVTDPGGGGSGAGECWWSLHMSVQRDAARQVTHDLVNVGQSPASEQV